MRQLVGTLEALTDLGPALTSECDLPETAGKLLSLLGDAIDSKQSALFRFSDKPSCLISVASRGFDSSPSPSVIPLLPSHVHALQTASGPLLISGPDDSRRYFTANGNFAPHLLKCISPLRVGKKLVGLLAFGSSSSTGYSEDELHAMATFSHYIALALQNNELSQGLAQRAAENLKLMASMHSFCDNALEAFAVAIDAKHINIRGHSIRVGRYAALLGESVGISPSNLSSLRASGYLHDIGKVAIDRRLIAKPSALDPAEFKEVAGHTLVGYQIVSGVQFPWPQVAEVVRSHHERLDGSGYPDRLCHDEISLHVRIMGVADAFDALTSERPYRDPFSVGEALQEIIKDAPQRFDPEVVQMLLVQVRRDAVAACTPSLSGIWRKSHPDKRRFLDERVLCSISPTDIDQLASLLQHKISNNRVYSN